VAIGASSRKTAFVTEERGDPSFSSHTLEIQKIKPKERIKIYVM
jgi:hypothetical protein